MPNLSLLFTLFFPPKPAMTEKDIPDLTGKVFAITGATSGIGLHLAKLLYAAGGTVFMFTRDESLSTKVVEDIRNNTSTTVPHSNGHGSLHRISIDLGDLATVGPAAKSFLEACPRLDILFNNAGIASAPLAYKTAQGLEPHFGTNCAAHHLLTKLLLPALVTTAKTAPQNSVRIIWTGSTTIDMIAPPGGIDMLQVRNPSKDRNQHYAASRVGHWYLASEWDKRFCNKEGLINVVQNPGNLKTRTWRTTPWYLYYLVAPVLYPGINGAYTNLWAAFGDKIALEDGVRHVAPFGRFHPHPREDMVLALKEVEEGGSGRASEFWHWCEEVTKDFV
ncbi:hypothetical protein B0J14DRAFT_595818 [Halenospora varia]|nr:hypothetical protein B0J14DRAFT_595818 [Halenospora varia]